MRLRLAALAIAALAVSAGSSPADACPGRVAAFDPPAGSLIHDGDAIVASGRAALRLAAAGELRLWARDHQIPLRLEADGGRVRMIPTRPLAVGAQYHLVAASTEHPGWTSPLGVGSPWWTAAEPDRQAELMTLAVRLGVFGLLPFALGYAATRTIIIRRRRRVYESLARSA